MTFVPGGPGGAALTRERPARPAAACSRRWPSAAPCAARVTIAVTLPVNTVVWLTTVLSVGFIGLGVLAGGLVADRIERLVSAEITHDQQQQP